MALTKTELMVKYLGYYEDVRLIITVTQLPSGALETAINSESLNDKLDYINQNYDEQLRLKRSPDIQIKGFLVV